MPSALLLSDINTRASVACLRSLTRKAVPVWCVTSGRSDGFVRFTRYRSRSALDARYRSSDAQAFRESLLSIAARIGEYVLYPTGERVLRWAVACRDALAASGILLPAVDLATYECVSDKQSFVALAGRHGLAVPKEHTEIPTRFARRFVVKPAKGVFDRADVLTSPCLIESEASLDLLRRRGLDPRAHFIQEYIEGPSYYYCALYDRGRRRLHFTQKTLTQQPDGRSVVRAVPSRLPERVENSIDSMMEALLWQGLMMIEVKESEGLYYAIECNPRIWGPLQLAVDNGFDFPWALWQLATGQPVDPEPTSAARRGYFWTAGYLHGRLVGRRTRTAFQRQPAEDHVRFRDVWLRVDTFAYFFVELAQAALALCRSGVRSLRKRPA